MRVFPIIILAAASGVMLGAGMSFYVAGPAGLPAPLRGKGPHFLVEAAPADVADASGAWGGAKLAAAETVDLPAPTPEPAAAPPPPPPAPGCADENANCPPPASDLHP